ncbi:MAG: hypothetical protein HWE23_01275 [Rhodobacteraceae bacterium]|nr:hypothetical protein [Paracoccaceae bacterium]
MSVAVLLSGPSLAGSKRSSCYEQAIIPAAYQVQHHKVLVRPAHKRVVKKPAVYGYQKRRVQIEPERISYQRTAPVYGYQSRKVMVQPPSFGWEYRIQKGRKILCKVKHPAIYSTVKEKVLVQRGGKVAVRHPAVYGYVKEKVVIEPATSYVVHEPAVYKRVAQTVKVREAQVVWQPIRVRSGCH